MKGLIIMKKRLVSKAVCLCAAAVTALSVCACGGNSQGSGSTAASGSSDSSASEESTVASSGEKINIKLNTSWGENCTVQDGALKFGELVQEKSGGRITVKVYPSNQLASGNQQTAVEMVQNGDIEASLFGMTVLSFLDDRLAIVNMPFLIPTYDDADALIYDKEAESRKMLDEVINENGLVSVAFGEAGYRQLTNNKKEIKTPDDMKGLKFRILSTCPMFFDLYETLGANPTAINMSEVFTSLQQGVVDGQENAVDTDKSYKLNEVQKYITCWNGVYDSVAFVASPKFMDSLSDDDKALIYECAEEAMAFQREEQRATEEEILAEFGQTMTVTKLTDDEINVFKDAVQPVYDKWYDLIGADLMETFGYSK